MAVSQPFDSNLEPAKSDRCRLAQTLCRCKKECRKNTHTQSPFATPVWSASTRQQRRKEPFGILDFLGRSFQPLYCHFGAVLTFSLGARHCLPVAQSLFFLHCCTALPFPTPFQFDFGPSAVGFNSYNFYLVYFTVWALDIYTVLLKHLLRWGAGCTTISQVSSLSVHCNSNTEH